MIYYVVEYRPEPLLGYDLPVRIHEVTMPKVTDKDGYRQASSMEGFRRNEQKRMFIGNSWRRRRPFVKRFTLKREDDLKFDLEFEKKCGTRFLANSPRVAYDSVWAFYTAIGYDYKAKRYNNEEVGNDNPV